MKPDFRTKSSVADIRARFDNDVARFANLDTGQQSTIDAPLSLELITEAAKAVNPAATTLLDLGCGAGNYTLKMLQKIPNLHCTLVDLSQPMLDKAKERTAAATTGTVTAIQADMRELELPDEQFDVILAGATLHHLRDDADWERMFNKIYRMLRPGGSFWISDLVAQDSEEINSFIWSRYGEYLEGIGGAAYRQHVLDYIEKEDSPRSVNFQLGLMRQAGFRKVEVLHKNLCFAAFGGIK
ncbi:class I SAM-dependent methyltransferase [Botryobacter ruber]|uniref:class I SAM-dependent methyltransferase n=1 Tax=Botryobacter ruber TaxID=2171629 RepID=UPI000E0A4390|nr:class I SAM-dependent methyltransferase [Botryobacter ruber]